MNDNRRKVIEKLLEKINSGEIVKNEKLLPERKIAEIIGETRPILREGLIALEAMGVLDIRDRQGVYLSPNEENDAKMLLQKVYGWPADMLSRAIELRQIIEPPSTALAAIRRDENDINKLQFCLAKLKPLSGKSDEDSEKLGTYWNKQFHTIIVQSTKNSYLSRVYESLHAIIEQGVYIMRNSTAPEELGGRKITYKDHEKIYKCVLSGDAAGAKLCAEEHLNHTIKAMVKLGQIVPASDLYEQKIIN
jgi:GntR family transcriptional repressor for pyruvate dehydrogenase complex